MKEYIEEAEKALLHTYNRFQIVLDKGEGVHLYDIEGKEYLDFVSGIAVFALGYNYKTRTDMSTYNRNFLSGFSAGVGLKVKSFAFSVSYAQPHKAGSSIMLNLSTNLYELLRR